MQDCLQLLHYHMGSQITNIRVIKNALNEAARVYVELAKNGAGMKYLDVGGGLGVDYDGSQTNFESSVNYTLQEYANDVIYDVQTVCDEAGVPHPDIISESGRAVVAYHSVLVFNVLGTAGLSVDGQPENLPDPLPETYEHCLWDLQRTFKDLHLRNALEASTTRSRRSTRRSISSMRATCRSSSAATPRVCTGRSAASSRT